MRAPSFPSGNERSWPQGTRACASAPLEQPAIASCLVCCAVRQVRGLACRPTRGRSVGNRPPGQWRLRSALGPAHMNIMHGGREVLAIANSHGLRIPGRGSTLVRNRSTGSSSPTAHSTRSYFATARRPAPAHRLARTLVVAARAYFVTVRRPAPAQSMTSFAQ